ncbi:MAG: EamA family transporter [Limnochordia bacterium]
MLPLALLYPVLFFGLQTAGLVYATSVEGGIISATSPIFTLILATVFLKEKSTPWQRS